MFTIRPLKMARKLIENTTHGNEKLDSFANSHPAGTAAEWNSHGLGSYCRTQNPYRQVWPQF